MALRKRARPVVIHPYYSLPSSQLDWRGELPEGLLELMGDEGRGRCEGSAKALG